MWANKFPDESREWCVWKVRRVGAEGAWVRVIALKIAKNRSRLCRATGDRKRAK